MLVAERMLRIEHTWHADVGQHRLLAIFDAADLGEVDVQSQQGHAAEEGHGAHEDPVVTGILVAVEDAVLLHLVGAVDVALVGDAAKDHDGEQLQKIQTGEMDASNSHLHHMGRTSILKPHLC